MTNRTHNSTATSRRQKRALPRYVRGALVLLRRFAEQETCALQREATTAWIDNLARMLEYPYTGDDNPVWWRAS